MQILDNGLVEAGASLRYQSQKRMKTIGNWDSSATPET